MAFAAPRAYVDKNVITDAQRKRKFDAHKRTLAEIKSKEGSYKLSRKQSTSLKLDFSTRMHR